MVITQQLTNISLGYGTPITVLSTYPIVDDFSENRTCWLMEVQGQPWFTAAARSLQQSEGLWWFEIMARAVHMVD